MVQPRKVKRGDPVRADEWNALVDAVAQKLRENLGGPMGGLGVSLNVPQTPSPTQIRLMQAIERPEKSNDDGRDEFGNGNQLWSMECYMVDIRSGAAGLIPDVDSGIVRVYFPTQYRRLNGNQDTIDHPPIWHQASDSAVQAGARFWAILNPGTGRWEYLGPPNQIVRVKLKSTLLPGNSATARVMWSQSGTDAPSEGEEITVYDWIVGGGAAENSLAYAMWLPDLGRWEVTFRESTPGQYGYAQIAPAYPDMSTGPLGAVEGLRLFRSNGYVQHDSNPASPVTTIGGGAGTEDGIRVERTGIWTGAFYVSIRIPTSASATPPGSYSDKILKVTGPAGSVNLATGAIDGASVVTHDGCLHELFIRRTFTVYINAVAISPRTNNDGYIATATVWNKIECDHITFFDATIPFTHYLEDGDYLQIFWDTDEDVGTVSGGSIDCATKLVLHYNNEPLP